MLNDGAIGRPCQGRRRIAHPGPPRNSWFYRKEIAQFGASVDMGGVRGLRAHRADGTGRSTSALITTFEDGVTIDDAATWLLQFESGATGTAETSWTEQARVEGTMIYGTEGVLLLNPPVVGAKGRPDELMLYRRTGGKSFSSRGEWVTIQVPPDPSAAPHRHFVQSILEDRVPRGTPRHARHVTEILLKGHESQRTGQRLELTTRF